jgi:hypothetical protein
MVKRRERESEMISMQLSTPSRVVSSGNAPFGRTDRQLNITRNMLQIDGVVTLKTSYLSHQQIIQIQSLYNKIIVHIPQT